MFAERDKGQAGFIVSGTRQHGRKSMNGNCGDWWRRREGAAREISASFASPPRARAKWPRCARTRDRVYGPDEAREASTEGTTLCPHCGGDVREISTRYLEGGYLAIETIQRIARAAKRRRR